jgi:hypothetical protein
VSGQYAASSGGEGEKFLAALTIQEQLSTITKRTLKVQNQNNEAQDTDKKKNPGSTIGIFFPDRGGFPW